MRDLPPTFAGIGWYSDYPDHYAGDARPSTVEKGRALVKWRVKTLAEYIAAVKADEVVPALEKEFFARVKRVGGE
jgi:creatinine amidohydrolase